MTPDQQVSAKPKRGMLMVITLCALILGFFLGIVFDAHFRPNTITFQVDKATNQVNVAPRHHDVINWIKQRNARPVTVGFLSDSPCEEAQPTSTCTITGPNGNYVYICVASDGTTYPCSDPGIDPNSSTNGPTLESVEVFLKGNPGNPAPQGPTNTTTPVSASSSTDTVVAGIQCAPNGSSNIPGVVWKYPPNPNEPLPVKVGQTIVWKPGSIGHFVINFNDPHTCTQQTIDSDNPICTVQNPSQSAASFSEAYQVTTSGTNACSTNPGNAALQVTP